MKNDINESGIDITSENGNEKVLKVKYKIPNFGNKYEIYITLIKEAMIQEIEQIKSKYNNIHKKHIELDTNLNEDNEYIIIITEILKYVQKYRTIACPNQYFINQLVKFCKLS